jgi:hydrogenase maturation protease
MHVRVIGLGSGFGDDAAGLAVIEWLEERGLLPGTALARCPRPVPDLLDAFEDADAAVLVDAARSGAPPGTVRELDEREIAARASASTHGLGALSAVRLARSLGRAPERLAWVGIAIGAVRPGAGLSEPVRAAIPEAGRRALAAAHRLAGARPGSDAGARTGDDADA